MSLYIGSGYRCRESLACGFRVFPSSGDDADLDEAARIRTTHENACAKEGRRPAPIARPTLTDRVDAVVAARADEDVATMFATSDEVAADHVRQLVAPIRRYRRRCMDCGSEFVAAGPNTKRCASCRSRRAA